MPDNPRTFQYQSSRRERNEEPVVLVIDGEEFKAYPDRISEPLLMELPGMVDETSQVVNFTPLWDLFRAALGDEYQRFHRLVTGPEHDIEAQTLANMMQDLVEQRAGRPTPPSSF